MSYVTTGDIIETEESFLRGHGTMMRGNQLVSTISGFVERVNKLVSVHPLNSRYSPEVGDVVIGRVLEVGDKSWRLDINSRQNGILMLSAVNLAGGVQRRRTAQDSLQMRTVFQENDLISAEVQKLMHDGACALHTRSSKYGKLQNGIFVHVPANLVKRIPNRFVTLSCGVQVILGNNGYIWISPAQEAAAGQTSSPASEEGTQHPQAMTAQGQQTSAASASESKGARSAMLPVQEREKLVRVRNSLLALARMQVAIHPTTVMDVYEDSVALGLLSKDILSPDMLQPVTQTAMSRRGQ